MCVVRQAVPIFIKIMEWDTPERYIVCKKRVSAKINQCALWNIKRQFLWLPWWNHDNARNKIAKSLTLASFTVALNKFVFLAFERQKGGLFLGACFPRKSWNFKALFKMHLSVVGAYWNITTVEPLIRAGDTLRTDKNCRDCPLNTL